MSLNVHLVTEGLVLRVHPRFVTGRRVTVLRRVRRTLLDHGLVVAEPISGDENVIDVGGRVGELERYVEATKPVATMDSYVWMFEAMGQLHAALAAVDVGIPVPPVATWSSPSDLRRRLTATAEKVAGDDDAAALATWARELTALLEAHWVAEERLPNQIIHGDMRLANVARTRTDRAAYFDFGFAAVRPRAFDLAYALSWIVLAPDDSGRADDFDWTIVPDLVGAYEADAGVTLTGDERRAIVPYLASVPLHLVSIACDTPDPSARIKLERPFLAIADWVLHHPSVLA